MQQYTQSTKYTCAAASLGMIINHFNPEFLLNIENEFDIWQKTVVLPTRGSSLYALALYASKQTIPLKIVVGEHDYKFPGYKFKSYKKKEISIAKFCSDIFYNKAKEEQLDIEERKIQFKEIKDNLKKGKILLLRLVIGVVRKTKTNRRNPHYLPVYGYDEKTNEYSIMDPRRGELKVDEETLKESFEKLDDIKRDARMIIFG